ncbi:MAG: aldehyde dehydrogenase family protein [Deltaproteobacteria bacterium]|nr:aldehyde dehydrogenase family protein [Deltaproteobacteria bacterium]
MDHPQPGLSLLSGASAETSAERFPTVNPARVGDVLATFGCATPVQVATACERARAAFASWKRMPAPVRAGVLQNFGRLLEANTEALARCVTREMGKPLREARGDVQEAIDTCNFFVSEGRRLYGMTVPSEMPNKECSAYRRPIGVFACITAGNFPVAVPSWYFVPALVAGNTCVWKPSEDTPLTSYYFAQLLTKAGLPDGVFTVLFGRGAGSTGAWLIDAVEKGWIDKFGFTGSTPVGRRIGEVCGRNLQTPCLELGGKNPLVVMEDADLELASTGAVWAGFGTAGQRCTSLGNLLLHETIRERFLKLLLAKVERMIIGDPMSESVTYGPMISEKFLQNHLRHLDTLVAGHHRLLTDPNGRIGRKKTWPRWIGGNPDDGWFCFPTIVDGVTPDDAIYSTETFGPLFNVLTFGSIEEAIRLANGTGYGLSSAIYTQTPAYVYQWKEEIAAGMTSINNSTTGAEAHLPFGGNGKSGNGSRQSGVWVLDQFTRWQAVNWDFSGTLQRAQMETGYLAAQTDYRIPS